MRTAQERGGARTSKAKEDGVDGDGLGLVGEFPEGEDAVAHLVAQVMEDLPPSHDPSSGTADFFAFVHKQFIAQSCAEESSDMAWTRTQ